MKKPIQKIYFNAPWDWLYTIPGESVPHLVDRNRAKSKWLNTEKSLCFRDWLKIQTQRFQLQKPNL